MAHLTALSTRSQILVGIATVIITCSRDRRAAQLSKPSDRYKYTTPTCDTSVTA